ncbi:MAG: restriction endonuclease [Candidatus Korobacteraceae bacterium]
MAEISPDTLAIWLSRDINNENFRALSEVCTDTLVSRLPTKSPEECADLAESLLPRVAFSLERIRSELLEDGVEPNFELSTDERTFYIKAVTSQAAQLLERLYALTPTEFERFCGRILETMGARVAVIGKSGDGGIDFVARDLPICSPAPIGARITVVGQAKKYAVDSFIKEHDLRAFIGSTIRKTSDPDDPHCFRRNILAPVMFAFWTTADFQPSARKFARGLGLWYLSGTALAQLALRLKLEP